MYQTQSWGFKKFPLAIRILLVQFNRNLIQSVINVKDSYYLTKLEAQRQVGSKLQDPSSASWFCPKLGLRLIARWLLQFQAS